MHTNCIKNLKDVLVKNIKNLNDKVEIIYIEVPKSEQTCPFCGSKTSKIHDYYKQTIKDINDKIRMYEKSKITMYKHTFFFVYFFRRYTKDGEINYTIEDIERNEFKTKLFSFS